MFFLFSDDCLYSGHFQPKTLVSRDGFNYKQRLHGRLEELGGHNQGSVAALQVWLQKMVSVCVHVLLYPPIHFERYYSGTDSVVSGCFSIFRKQILCCCWSLCSPKSGACVVLCHMLFRSSAFLLHQAETKWFSSLQLVAGCSWMNWNDSWGESSRGQKKDSPGHSKGNVT